MSVALLTRFARHGLATWCGGLLDRMGDWWDPDGNERDKSPSDADLRRRYIEAPVKFSTVAEESIKSSMSL
jgi:hypothetical protein